MAADSFRTRLQAVWTSVKDSSDVMDLEDTPTFVVRAVGALTSTEGAGQAGLPTPDQLCAAIGGVLTPTAIAARGQPV